MPRPAYFALGEAIASVMDLAGVTTVALAEQLRERGWKPDQSLVSKWRNGHQRPHDIDMYPDIESICGVARGTILRRAGYVENGTDLRAAILTAPELNEQGRKLLADTYDAMRLLKVHPVDLDDPDERRIWELPLPEDERWREILRWRAARDDRGRETG